jgi:hypothetical protein
MKIAELLDVLDQGKVAPISLRDWSRFKTRVQIKSSHETGSHGLIHVGEIEGRVVVVELADESLRAVRSFDKRSAADAFVQKRLDQYDRLWDG